MSFNFGENSKKRLDSCHKDLQLIHKLAISRTKVDYGISEGHRSLKRQKELYDKGYSQVDGIRKKGKHNYLPSLATDIYIYHPDLATRRKLAYDKGSLCYVAGIIDACAEELLKEGFIEHKIRWGGNWDSDGIILIDQSFDDLPHFELIHGFH